MPFAIWITGLPGSGKSTIAKELIKGLPDTEYLRLDEIRKKFTSEPEFTDEGRDAVYDKLVEEGLKAISSGRNVVYDATAHKLKWRNAARKKIGNFLEAHIDCPVETCIKRESQRKDGLVLADLYKKALERKRTGRQFEGLGEVVGVDVPYEKNSNAEMTIDSSKRSPEEAAGIILSEIKKRGWI